mgnify:CR=1 FL=1
MKKVVFKIFVVMIFFIIVTPTYAQFNIKKAIGGAAKAVKAFTLTDEQMAEYVKESVDWMNIILCCPKIILTCSASGNLLKVLLMPMVFL